ncbi:hypothetical protein GWI33_006890 [Rhynchophorus ferrugineus]|uniref:Mos1 transposase HTH domain-containing protein n=1 Tax=Rhynchophorus ferrugineus TaxID=354439 RepID=A0A834ITS1_RHYFE|nr:hypothetical protein GWI33_006890 [Rhynchophorus ferrugineus]
MDKNEFRVLIKYCFLKGKNTVEAKTRLDAEFLDTVPGKSTIKHWYAKFRRGEMRTEDSEHCGPWFIRKILLTTKNPRFRLKA